MGSNTDVPPGAAASSGVADRADGGGGRGAVLSLVAFLQRIEPRLARQGITVTLKVREERSVQA